MRIPVVLLASFLFPCLCFAAETDRDKVTIAVGLYSVTKPSKSFETLDELGKIVMHETGSGFIRSSYTWREQIHYGASVCIKVDPKLSDAEEQTKRILARINELKSKIPKNQDQIVNLEVHYPSDCWSLDPDLIPIRKN